MLQLLDTDAVGVRREKMYKLADHIACAVAGITGEYLTVKLACTGNTAFLKASEPAAPVLLAQALP